MLLMPCVFFMINMKLLYGAFHVYNSPVQVSLVLQIFFFPFAVIVR